MPRDRNREVRMEDVYQDIKPITGIEPPIIEEEKPKKKVEVKKPEVKPVIKKVPPKVEVKKKEEKNVRNASPGKGTRRK